MPNSVNLSWNDLIMRVANKVGIIQPTPYQIKSITYFLQDALIKIRGISEDIRIINKKVAVFNGASPTVPLTVTLSAGSTLLLSGFYKYAYSYYNSLIGESDFIEIASPIELTDNTIQRIFFELPNTLPHGVEKFIVYRTKVNGSVYYKHSEHTTGGSKLDAVEDTSLTELRNITEFADTADATFPSDAFLVTEIQFYDVDNVLLLSKETSSEDEFTRVTGNYSYPDGEVITTEGIQRIPTTFEDLTYQNTIRYTLRKTYPLKFTYQPRFNGYIKFNYSVIPEVIVNDLDSTPEIAYTFSSLLVQDATISYIKSLMVSEKLNEIAIQSLAILLRVEKSEYDINLKRYLSYVHRNVGSPSVRLHDFLNDPKMELL